MLEVHTIRVVATRTSSGLDDTERVAIGVKAIERRLRNITLEIRKIETKSCMQSNVVQVC
jgi:hypothetical protein